MDHGVSIPHIFHHVWTSGDAMPEPVLATRQTWIERIRIGSSVSGA